ncbi:3-oxoacyl-ACP reductase FabG [Nocardioides dubius]|uniref:3-oxoacyl-ACP reductase FabG n=1 Tax=Nocardioides dubius TaxID=317019 RepID=UPI0031D63514
MTVETAVRRTAIVTGAGRGIGAAVARRLAREGLAVAVFDLDAEAASSVAEEIRSAGGTAGAFGVDVADEGAVQAAVDDVAQSLGAPVVLVNNAGITRDNMLHKMSVDDWDSVMSVHLRGAFLLSRAVQPHLKAERWGRIVNLSSMSAFGNVGQANYAAAKAGIWGFTKTLALEIGRHGATCNAIAPGFIQTEMTRATAERLGVTFEELIESSAKETPVGRVGVPEDIAHAVAFFVSEQSGFVSGQVLTVAGGPKG